MKNLNLIFITTIILMAFSFIYPHETQAGEVYKYTDENGNTVITNDSIPEKYQRKAQKIGSYKLDSPEEIKRYHAEPKAKEQGREVCITWQTY